MELNQYMEPYIACFYLTYCMEHMWKSSLWIAIYISTTKNTIDRKYTEGEGGQL